MVGVDHIEAAYVTRLSLRQCFCTAAQRPPHPLPAACYTQPFQRRPATAGRVWADAFKSAEQAFKWPIALKHIFGFQYFQYI